MLNFENIFRFEPSKKLSKSVTPYVKDMVFYTFGSHRPRLRDSLWLYLKGLV